MKGEKIGAQPNVKMNIKQAMRLLREKLLTGQENYLMNKVE